MGPAVRLAALLAVLALQAGDLAGVAARGDTFSALTSVARALAPERRLLGLLRRYLRGEEARLRDLTSAYHEPSTVPGTRERMVNKTKPCPLGAQSL
uniref:Uncharacterized protein n=1 Tax=Monodon monoceros TaxID=40151 RepID=A0A8C6F3F4_MONMO